MVRRGKDSLFLFFVCLFLQTGARTHQVVENELSQLSQDLPIQNKMCLNCVNLVAGQNSVGLCLKVDVALAEGVYGVGHMLCLCVSFCHAKGMGAGIFLLVVDLEKQQNAVM